MILSNHNITKYLPNTKWTELNNNIIGIHSHLSSFEIGISHIGVIGIIHIDTYSYYNKTYTCIIGMIGSEFQVGIM